MTLCVLRVKPFGFQHGGHKEHRERQTQSQQPIRRIVDLFAGKTYAPISHPPPKLFWFSKTIPPGKENDGLSASWYVDPKLVPASIAGDPTSNVKLRLAPLVRFGSELREGASCELFVFQFAKL